MMDPFSLSAISADPRSGVKSITRRVTIVLQNSPEVTIKENLHNSFNQLRNKFYPDIGAILLGYKNVKYARVSFDWSQGDSKDEIVTLRVRADFLIFSAEVGSSLWCTVKAGIVRGSLNYRVSRKKGANGLQTIVG